MKGREISFQPDGTVVVHLAANAQQAQQAFDQLRKLLHHTDTGGWSSRPTSRRRALYQEALDA